MGRSDLKMLKSGTDTTKTTPTIYDVARVAGVGRSTVSRVLNSQGEVSEETRERVRQAIKELGYTSNAQAKTLASGKYASIGLVYAADPNTEPNSYYYSALEIGALRACNQYGFKLQIHCISDEGLSSSAEVFQVLKAENVDGVILTPSFSDDIRLLEALKKAGIPFVSISSGRQARAMTPGVGIDDEAAGYELGTYLIGLGHKTFAYMHGMPGDMAAAERFVGFERALREAGIPLASVRTARGNFTFQSGIELLSELISAPRPTAVVCANDDMAAGAVFRAHELGISLPKELTITGFDGAPVSEITWPPLTTIRQPLKEMGERAGALLINAINFGGPPKDNTFITLPHELIVRRSSIAPNP